jgi:hypothetical protein
MGYEMLGAVEKRIREAGETWKILLSGLKETLDKRRQIHVPETEQVQQDFYRDLFSLHYMQSNRSWPIVRLLTVASYVIGFGILAIPSLDVFWRVLKATWRMYV